MGIWKPYYAFRIPTTISFRTIVVTYLTPEEEKDLDKGYPIDIKRDVEKFRINPRKLIVYGEIDFDDSSEDLDVLEDLNLFSKVLDLGFCLPSNFDYKNSCYYADANKKIPLFYDSCSTDRVLQYIHAKLGKPNITVVFEYEGVPRRVGQT